MPSPYPVDEPVRGSVRPRLWRSRRNKVFAGVIGGLSEKFEFDLSAMRIMYAALTVVAGVFPGVVLYLVLWAITAPRGDEG